MRLKARSLVDEIEEIKTRLVTVEMTLLESEEASKEDKEALKEALKEYRKGRTIPLSF